MDDKRMTDLLLQKIEWMDQLYRAARDLEQYRWIRVNGVRHRCGGDVCVFVETTGIGYVCTKCEDAEVL